eukprot:TRINITY_DN14487_c0_g8_i1.p1 TRINITY_DN14487_c0_g8~~TRINITY_DN14487_c0_g8_i1.p1  ORF type:complete len:919 (-),score=137.37 TRINITY_DN14487_c0_g8_i1:161-2803(-)
MASGSGVAPRRSTSSQRQRNERFPLSTFSPLVCAGLKWWPEGTGRVDGELRMQLQRVRLAWIIALIMLYGIILINLSVDQQVTAGARVEQVDEFFPDAGKASERIKEGEVVAGGKEYMHADDVAQTLAWFTTFCRMKQATDDHIKDSWLCNLMDINIGDTNAARWDASMNRALPDDQTDSVNYIKKVPVFDFSVPQQEKNVSKQRLEAMQQICSRRFLTDHFVIGDDPIKESKGGSPEPSAGFRDPEQFARNYLKDILPGFVLDEDFEELGDDPHLGLESIDEHLNAIRNGEDGDADDSDLKSERENSVRSLTSMLEKDAQSSVKSYVAQSMRALNSTRHSRTRNRKASRQGTLRGDDEDDDEAPYHSGCFDRSDIGGVIREVWEVADRDADLQVTLHQPGAKKIASMLGDDEDREVIMTKLYESDADADGKLSVDEYYSFVRRNLHLMKIPGRGYLSAKCRNHHFGLVGLCKPSHIVATYVARRIQRKAEGVYVPLEEVRTKISFTNAGTADGSGWYNFQYEITTVSAMGQRGIGCLVIMCMFLLLVSLLFVYDFVATVISWPLNIWRLFQLRIPSGMSFLDAKTLVWARLNALLDHRGCRCRYVSFTQLCLELSISILLVISTAEAARESLTPVYLPSGSHDQLCLKATLTTDLEWMSASFHGQQRRRGLTPLEYVFYCRPDLSRMQKITEMTNSILFEAHDHPYGFVLALMCLRACQLLEHSRRLKWLPQTLALARPKVCEFLVAYTLLVAAFATVLHIQFGDLYAQFSSFKQSFVCLFLYSLGDTDRATEGLHAFIEKSSTEVTMYLLAYTLIVVTICLNVFTTIIIDAYSSVCGKEGVEKILKDRDDEYTRSLIRAFAENPEEWYDEADEDGNNV